MLDGVREEQKDREADYLEYIKRLVGLSVFKWKNISLVPFEEFTHQANMTMKTLELVNSPYILYLEHDTPILERPIDWEMLKDAILSGATNHIRLHYDESIHPDHEYMMRGYLTSKLIRTIQFHNRPYIANAGWLKKLLAANFTEQSRSFIEDVVYSPVSCSEWSEYRLTVYDPDGTGQKMKRSSHTCGRGEDPKFEIIR
jgi:hypothetical protein